MNPPTEQKVDPFTATYDGQPIFSSHLRSIARQSAVGGRFNVLNPILRALHEILCREVQEGERGRHILHLEHADEHVLKALSHLEDSVHEFRRVNRGEAAS